MVVVSILGESMIRDTLTVVVLDGEPDNPESAGNEDTFVGNRLGFKSVVGKNSSTEEDIGIPRRAAHDAAFSPFQGSVEVLLIII